MTEDFGSIRFEDDGMVFTIAFAPGGGELPVTTSVQDLSGVGSELGPDPADVPEGDAPAEPGDESTTETEGTTEGGATKDGDTTSSSAPSTSETDS